MNPDCRRGPKLGKNMITIEQCNYLAQCRICGERHSLMDWVRCQESWKPLDLSFAHHKSPPVRPVTVKLFQDDWDPNLCDFEDNFEGQCTEEDSYV